MTLSIQTSRVSYNGDGAQTVFDVTFPFVENAHIEAVLREAGGEETAWVENTDYTLTGGNGTTGVLTATEPPIAGATLLIRRIVPLTQEVDYPENGRFPAASHELALDLARMVDQQQQEVLDRSIKVPTTDPSSSISELPNCDDRRGMILGFDGSTGAPITVANDGASTTATATGSTQTRLLADRFADQTNVLDHGASGDGELDDLTKFRSAKNLATDKKGEVFVPATANAFRLNGRLTLNDGVDLVGQGEGSHLSFSDGSSGGDLGINSEALLRWLKITFGGPQGIFANVDAQNVHLMGLRMIGNGKIALQLDVSGIERWVVTDCIIHDPSYGLLANFGSTGRSMLFAHNIVENASASSVELNFAQQATPKFEGVIVSGNFLDCDPAGTGDNSGFVIGVAGGRFIVIGDLIARQTRQEALHLEDALEGLTVHDVIVPECRDDGICMFNRESCSFDANGDVDLETNSITVVDHKMMSHQRMQYRCGDGTSIGGLASLTSYYAIVVDDNTLQLAAAPGGGAIRLTSKPASEVHTLQAFNRGWLFNNLWLRKRNEDLANTGVNFVDNSGKSVEDMIFANAYVRGFGTGFDFGETEGAILRNFIAENCAVGVNFGDRRQHASYVEGGFIRDCATGIQARRGAKVGHVTFKGVETFFNVTSFAGQGLTSKGHAGQTVHTHAGGTSESIDLFPLGTNDRMRAYVTAHGQIKGGSADNWMRIAEIVWDGTTLTEIHPVSRNSGGAAANAFNVFGGNFRTSVFSAAARTYEIFWDVMGFHYIE